MAIARDYVLIVAAAWIGVQLDHWVAYLAIVWFIGLVQLGLGETLTHEACHGNLFKSPKLNLLSEFFCCYPFFFTLEDYKREHREHHRLLNSDQEKLHQDYQRHGLLDENPNLVWHWFIKPILGYSGRAYLRSVVDLATTKSAPRVVIFWAILVTLSVWGEWFQLLFLYWIVPLIWSFASFFYWSEIEDHFNTKTGTRTNIGWTNWLTHNNGYHAVHHQFPRIPWYRLREAHQVFYSGSPDISRGFLDTFRQISARQRELGSKAAPSDLIKTFSV